MPAQYREAIFRYFHEDLQNVTKQGTMNVMQNLTLDYMFLTVWSPAGKGLTPWLSCM